jgi:outer membrane protein OmpA-like peptidoglycan-associated protein
MRLHTGSMLGWVGTIALLSGCATTGALKRAQQQNADALAQASAQQTAALSAEAAQRASTDSALRQQLGLVQGDVQQLKTDLQSMRNDFNAKITAMQDGLHFDMPVNFAFNDATVRPEDQASLTRFAHVVQQYYPQSKVTVEGFADPAGSARYNLVLSERRAKSVADYLAAQGMSPALLETVGYGKTRLVTPKAWGDQPGAELNRRAVFVIETKGQTSVALANPSGTP